MNDDVTYYADNYLNYAKVGSELSVVSVLGGVNELVVIANLIIYLMSDYLSYYYLADGVDYAVFVSNYVDANYHHDNALVQLMEHIFDGDPNYANVISDVDGIIMNVDYLIDVFARVVLAGLRTDLSISGLTTDDLTPISYGNVVREHLSIYIHPYPTPLKRLCDYYLNHDYGVYCNAVDSDDYLHALEVCVVMVTTVVKVDDLVYGVIRVYVSVESVVCFDAIDLVNSYENLNGLVPPYVRDLAIWCVLMAISNVMNYADYLIVDSIFIAKNLKVVTEHRPNLADPNVIRDYINPCISNFVVGNYGVFYMDYVFRGLSRN